ncbi:MAG: SDR family NAD(P)-dependent oxidoreductase [Deltaproteobacteria bacterium]|nr:SDR family NAD(P)-dependent oxidoreductase [Deltaproteobacteria bacterium]
MRVLVTGAAGFIASHIADVLVGRGDEVVVLDDLSNGVVTNIPEGAAFIEGDVRDPAAVDRAFTALAGPIEGVCHLAGQASTFKSFDEPAWDMDVNGVGTARMLEGARRHGAKTFLYASSMTAYGHPERLPVTEDQRCAPVSYYGITKWAAEQAVLISSKPEAMNLKAACFRMFNVYGPRQSLTNPYQGVLGIFLGNVLRDEPIRIFGDGEQSRDFVYVGDVAAAWVAALDGPPDEAAALNIGTATQTSINELWRAAVTACGRDPETYPVSYEETRPGDQRHMRANIDKACATIGWEPQVSFAEGMKRTADWARGAV